MITFIVGFVILIVGGALYGKLSEKIFIMSIITNEHIIKAFGNIFFGIFFIIVIAASRIRKPTAILIPLKALAITVISRKLSKNIEIK